MDTGCDPWSSSGSDSDVYVTIESPPSRVTTPYNEDVEISQPPAYFGPAAAVEVPRSMFPNLAQMRAVGHKIGKQEAEHGESDLFVCCDCRCCEDMYDGCEDICGDVCSCIYDTFHDWFFDPFEGCYESCHDCCDEWFACILFTFIITQLTNCCSVICDKIFWCKGRINPELEKLPPGLDLSLSSIQAMEINLTPGQNREPHFIPGNLQLKGNL